MSRTLALRYNAYRVGHPYFAGVSDDLSSDVGDLVREWSGGRTVLLGVSGGRDSMVLWAMLREEGLPHAVAHVDYRLRGADSDADRTLVVSTARAHGVEVHVITNVAFGRDTSNLQARARALRREAFEQLCREHDYGLILLAHHADDQLETILLGLMRGGGPRALAGMQVWRTPYLRPLLAAPRSDLVAYAEAHGVAYREDSSNRSSKYLRNRLRHEVVPNLLDIRSGARAAVLASAEVLSSLLEFSDAALEASVENCRDPRAGYRFLRPELARTAGLRFVLWQLLQSLRPTPEVISAAIRLIESGPDAPQWRRRNSLAIGESHALVITEAFVWLEERSAVPAFAREWTLDDAAETSWVRLESGAHGTLSIGPSTAGGGSADLSPSRMTLACPRTARLVWRTARRADRLAAGGGRSTRVRSVLAQAGLPPVSWGRATVLTVDEEVVWVVGVRRATHLQGESVGESPLTLAVEFQPRAEPYGVVRLSA